MSRHNHSKTRIGVNNNICPHPGPQPHFQSYFSKFPQRTCPSTWGDCTKKFTFSQKACKKSTFSQKIKRKNPLSPKERAKTSSFFFAKVRLKVHFLRKSPPPPIQTWLGAQLQCSRIHKIQLLFREYAWKHFTTWLPETYFVTIVVSYIQGCLIIL